MNVGTVSNLEHPVEYGIAHGRFQPLHLGHIEYLLAAKMNSRCLIVGITSPDISHQAQEVTNPHRALNSSNPLTYYERMVIVRESLLREGIKRDELEIVPYHIDKPELIKFYVPSDAMHFITIYDEWNREKQTRLIEQGYAVHVLWTRTMDDRLTEGRIVRRRIAEQRPWEYLVPTSAVQIIKQFKLDSRIRELWLREHATQGK